MASLSEIDTRSSDNRNEIILLKQTVADLQSNTIEIPKGAIPLDNTDIPDKTDWLVYGTTANINSGKFFLGKSSVASPTTDAHISEFIHRQR